VQHGASAQKGAAQPTVTGKENSMNGPALHQTAMRVAGELPAVTHTFPFGPEHNVFKVVGKIFLLASTLAGKPIVTLKCEPEYSQALRQEFATITPGYHLNKKHWITITTGPGVTEELVEELMLNAYLLVAENLPKAKQPLGLADLQRARELVVEEDSEQG
jgi:predicted DNA-binding protein (MmcQ/YjbR family)